MRTVRESVVVPVEIGAVSAAADAPRSLVSNTSLGDFRVGVAAGLADEGVFRLTADEAAALNVKAGDPVRVLPLKSKQG